MQASTGGERDVPKIQDMSAVQPSLSPPQRFPQRVPCPPGACICGRTALKEAKHADSRILLLTQEEENLLVQRWQGVQSLSELRNLQQRMLEQLGLRLIIAAGKQSTQGLRGLQIELVPITGLCRKTAKALPAAVRHCLENHPEIAFALLDESSLFAGL